MLHRTKPRPILKVTAKEGEIPELSLEGKLSRLASKSGLTAFERDFCARLRAPGYHPDERELIVFDRIWSRHSHPVRKLPKGWFEQCVLPEGWEGAA